MKAKKRTYIGVLLAPELCDLILFGHVCSRLYLEAC